MRKSFRVNSKRAKLAEVFILISGILSILSFVSNCLEYLLLTSVRDGVSITMEQATWNDSRQLILAVLQFIFTILCAITFIQWFRRAYYNQEAKFSFMTTTNGWTSGAWFIPIYSWYRPFQLMKELYVNGEEYIEKNTLGENKLSRLQIVGWWWGLWVFANISQNIVTRFSLKATELDSLISISFVSMIIDLLYIPLTILAIKTIRNYNEMELVLLAHAGDDSYAIPVKNDDLLDSGI